MATRIKRRISSNSSCLQRQDVLNSHPKNGRNEAGYSCSARKQVDTYGLSWHGSLCPDLRHEFLPLSSCQRFQHLQRSLWDGALLLPGESTALAKITNRTMDQTLQGH